MSASELRRPILGSGRNTRTRTYSIQTTPENEHSSILSNISQTIGNLQIHDKLFVAILLVIFFWGVLIGVYLLITEGHARKAPGIYNLTSRELWKAHVPTSEIPKLKLPARRVLFLQTNSSSSCDNESHCTKLMQQLQQKHMNQWKEPDIMYNFIVSGDGNIFEGRGWKFQTPFNDNLLSDEITIAFTGKFQVNKPTRRQVESTKLFVNEAVSEGKLERCIYIDVGNNNKFFVEFVRNMRKSLTTCGKIT